MRRELKPHGTYAAYVRHLRHNEEACAECKRAARNRTRAARGTDKPQKDYGYRAARSGFTERLAEYIRLRQDGMDSWDAAMAIGVDPSSSAGRYERWMNAQAAP